MPMMLHIWHAIQSRAALEHACLGSGPWIRLALELALELGMAKYLGPAMRKDVAGREQDTRGRSTTGRSKR